jgi:hypothetical protein
MNIALPCVRITSLFILAFSFLFPASQGFAQDFGRFKPGITWKQINTPTIRVIFPEGLESQANKVAGNILYLNQHNRISIGPLSKKLDLILNNQGVISNGYVALMPFRSEFYTTPMQNGSAVGTNPWLDILSIHEYRHALQYINMRQGFTKLAWLLFGDAGWGTLINLTTPAWFFEGDAVATETALTNQGRGRIPSFFQQYRSILLNDKKYNYMKARNGSFRDIVPDEYELGYLLCSYGREKFGNDLWPKVIQQTSWLKGVIYPFSDAVMAYTGLSTRQFYNKALSDYKESWSAESSLTDITPQTRLSKPSATVTEYRFPVYQTNGDLLVYKDSFKETGAICRILPDGDEEKICTMGISQDPYFTASGNLIAWTEVTWDERYSSENYSDVVTYQTDRCKKIYLTRKQRYFSPALSPDGTRIVVAEVGYAGNCSLKIIDSQTGTVISTLPNQENLFYTYPKWDYDGTSIISSARTLAGSMLIIKQSVSSGLITHLSGEINQILGEALVTPDSILFSSGFSGVNNIYSLTRSDGMIKQLTGSRFGASYPAINRQNRRLVYSDFDIDGHRLVSVSMDSLLWKPIENVSQNEIHMFEFKYFQGEGGNILDKIPNDVLEVAPYRQWQHPIRIHSWTFTPGFYSVGINLISDNILNNIHIEGEGKYYYNEAAPGLDAKILYGGLYPILSAGVSRNYRHPNVLDVIDGTEASSPLSLDNSLSFGVNFPLNFTKGATYRQANISLDYNYISSKDLTMSHDATAHVSVISAISGKVRIAGVKKKAFQNIATPLGMSLELTANQSVGFTYAAQYQAIGDLAFRGFAPNHNLVLSAGYKSESDQNHYHFMDLFLYPRGYSIPRYDWMVTLQSAYHFPLLYPDFGFLGIFYCSRIRADIFADYGYASIPASLTNESTGIFASAGTEIIFDTRWFNIAEIPLGFRFSLLLNPDFEEPLRRTRVEFVLPILRL